MNFFVFAILPILGILGKTLPESTFVGTDFPVVEIPDGKIIGTYGVTEEKTAYQAFTGIPYAKPPLDTLRFAPPVKNDKWTGYWNATKDATKCIQGSGDNVRGSEDCLYINVYTPDVKKNLPVMVWFHGGAFTGGDSKYDSFTPYLFLNEEVVFVSLNYRLGVLGFLSTENTVASGNWGLKDQVLALEWVKANIQFFGGNPNKVTIFGESAGGASVSYLLQIPKAQGLFHAAILQSGTSEMLWALSTRARNTAFRVGARLGIRTLLSKTLINRLRKIDAYKLQAEAMSIFSTVFLLNPLRGLPFSPVVEVNHTDAVFTQKSDEYFRSGGYPSKVPTLIGYNSNEAGFANALADTLRSYLLLFDITNSLLTPFSLTSKTRLRNLAAKDIKSFWFGANSIRDQPDQVVKLINTDQFNRATIRVAENIAPFAPTYFYIFGYEGQVVGNNSYEGVGHAEELLYMFKTPDLVFSAKDLEVSGKLMRLWTNFAKHFNPTPTKDKVLDNVIWPAINPKSQNLDFAWLNGTISLGTNPDNEAQKFYDSVFDKYGGKSYTTY